MNILVIDAGTSSMRGILFDHKGLILAKRQIKYQVSFLEKGYVTQNPLDWKRAILQIIKEIVEEKRGEIGAISITAQRSSVLAFDKSMNPLYDAIMWQDKRVNEICEKLESYNDRIFTLTGSRVNPVFLGCKIKWFKEKKRYIYDKTYKFLTVADYLIYILTGNICTDYTYGSRSLLMNIHTKQWDKELLEIFGISQEKLCPLVEPGRICGEINETVARITNCPAKVPVITAGGDQQCGAVGQGVYKKENLAITMGTGGYLLSAIEQIPKDIKQDVIINCSSVYNQYILESNILTCCSAFDWFCNNFYENYDLHKIDQEVEASCVGANGCLVLPYFQGRSNIDWNNNAKAFFANVTLNTKRCDMLRALLESICYEIKNGIDIIEKYTKIEKIFVNGGLTNSEPFNKIQCNVYGKKIYINGDSDATSRGALVIATVTLKLYESIEEAYATICNKLNKKIYIPEQEKVLIYQKCWQKMNELYKKIYV